MLALLTVVVLLACISGGRRSVRLIYLISILLYLPSVLSISGINWAQILGLPVEAGGTQLFGPILLTGLVIVAGYLWLLCTSWFEDAHRGLIERGGARVEVNAAVSGKWRSPP